MVTDTTMTTSATIAITPVEAIEQRRAKLLSELDRFIEVVVPALQPERIIVFGSYATGHIHEWSDLDLVVIAETDLPLFERLKQVSFLARSTVGMDVLVYTPAEWEHMKANRLFVQEEIFKKGEVVYDQGSAATARGLLPLLPSGMDAEGKQSLGCHAPVAGSQALEAQPWVDQAAEDLASVRVLAVAGIWAHACFHAQQCVEKLLKAALLSQGVLPPRRPNLNQLLSLLNPDFQNKLSTYRAALTTLDGYHMSAPYADILLGFVSRSLPDADDAVEALVIAEQILGIMIVALREP